MYNDEQKRLFVRVCYSSCFQFFETHLIFWNLFPLDVGTCFTWFLYEDLQEKPWRARHIPKIRAWCCFLHLALGSRGRSLETFDMQTSWSTKTCHERNPNIVFSAHSKTIFIFSFFFVTLKGPFCGKKKQFNVEIWSPATRYTLYVESISHPLFMNRPNGRLL